MKKPNFVTVSIEDFSSGEKLPCDVYTHVNYQFALYRKEGDSLDASTLSRMILKNIEYLFIDQTKMNVFLGWSNANKFVREEDEKTNERAADFKVMRKLRDDMNREALDIFQVDHPHRTSEAALRSSKILVETFMRSPHAIKPISLLQSVSSGIANHSTNVAVLSVYLANQMGYNHAIILQHLGLGSLLHDIGKLCVKYTETTSPEKYEEDMKKHPELGVKLLETMGELIPKEVKMIVQQHHEYNDGSGYPNRVKGSFIYDLARIVAISNQFDHLVADGQGALIVRQRNALRALEVEYSPKFDRIKLEKIIKNLSFGI